MTLTDDIRQCHLCAERFRLTKTGHAPRPVVWFQPSPMILIAGQAPGNQVHEKGVPFLDRSGDRLRDWMGVDRDTFYDTSRISILPTAFCFPGYDHRGADLPPPPICWNTWHQRVLQQIGSPTLRILTGAHAIKRHLGTKGPLTPLLKTWRDHAPATFLLPHPSWRNTAWMKANPWFEADVLPDLRAAVARALRPPP